jgi:hypothetical protein
MQVRSKSLEIAVVGHRHSSLPSFFDGRHSSHPTSQAKQKEQAAADKLASWTQRAGKRAASKAEMDREIREELAEAAHKVTSPRSVQSTRRLSIYQW